MSLNFPVTLVVPILNEAASLPTLLLALKAQSHRPDEIIFSDAGSCDGSTTLIEAWWCREGWENASCCILSRPGAMPGAGRNAGVHAARNDWVAFIDGGITPADDWLEQLCRHAMAKKIPAVFGVCRFTAETAFQRTLCALSNGLGAVHPVVPASLFRKEVFTTAGYFPEHLRAAEDLLWVSRYESAYGARVVCWNAEVLYRHFPMTWLEAARKWQMAEYFSVLAGVRIRQQATFLMLLPLLYAALLSGTTWGAMVFSAYLILRGIADPVRRSRPWQWWGGHPRTIFMAIPMCALLDAAKFAGIIRAWLARGRGQAGSLRTE